MYDRDRCPQCDGPMPVRPTGAVGDDTPAPAFCSGPCEDRHYADLAREHVPTTTAPPHYVDVEIVVDHATRLPFQIRVF